MLGSEHVLVVHSRDGLDEISIGDETQIVELRDGVIGRYEVTPENFGLDRSDLDSLKVDNAEESLRLIRQALSNQPGPARDIVQLNAGAALYVAGLSDSLVNGVTRAGQVLASGTAAGKLDSLVEFTRGL